MMPKLAASRLLPCTALSLAIVAAVLLPTWGHAGPLPAGSLQFTTKPGSDNDGPVAATVLFTPISGGIEITITNTETVSKRGQAVSALSFSVGGGLSTPTAFYELDGSTVKSASFTPGQTFPGSAKVTPITDKSSTTGPNAIDHWGFTPGTTVTLETAGKLAPGGNPTHMILPSSGTTGPAKSLADGHFDPYLIGPVNFFLSVPGVTATTDLSLTNITGVSVGFGTGADVTVGTGPATQGPPHKGHPSVSGVPAPPSAILLGLGGLIVAGVLARSRRRLAVAA